MLAEMVNLPLRMHLSWLLGHDVSIERIAKHCNCSVEQVQGLRSGKWREPASLLMEYKILELVEFTIFLSRGEAAAKEAARKSPPRRLSTYYVPEPSFMPSPPAKDHTNIIEILNFYKCLGFTPRIVCEFAGISEIDYERALFGNANVSCRRGIINGLDKYKDYFF